MELVLLYLIRHGTTALNSAGRFRGKEDPPLDLRGEKDADEIVAYLQSVHAIPEFIVSSSKRRAEQTAETISSAFKTPYITTDSLSAWNVGAFSGQKKNKETLDLLEQYIKDPETPIPEGESLNNFRERILPVLQECFEHAMEVGTGFIIVHSSIVHETGTQITGDHKALVVKPGGVVAIGLEDGKIVGKRVFKPLFGKNSGASVS